MKRFLCSLVLLVATAAPALADATGDVRSAMGNMAKASSFHLQANAKGQTVDIDMIPPTKMHGVMGSMEAIKIDNEIYVKLGETWHKFSIPGVGALMDMYKGYVDGATHPAGDMAVTDLGPKTVDGVSLHAYAVKNTVKSKEIDTTMFLDGGGNIARIEAPAGVVIRISKFNAPLTIAAPI